MKARLNGHYVYVDNEYGFDGRAIHPSKAQVACCTVCRGLHILRPITYMICSNEQCLPNPWNVFVSELVPVAGDEADLYLAAYAVGGAQAVLEILAAQDVDDGHVAPEGLVRQADG